MRLLANENIPASAIKKLRAAGFDVLSAAESMAGASDLDVLARAQSESRVLITQDKDFGELAFRSGLSAACGVILFRLAGGSPDQVAARMTEVASSREVWAGLFAVATDDRVRIRDLPPASQSRDTPRT